MRPSPRASAHRRCSPDGPGSSGPRSRGEAAVSGELRFPPAFGRAGLRIGHRGRRSGPRAGRSAGCGGSFGDRSRPVGTDQSRSGDGGLLRKLSVRRRKPGCPADPGFRMGGAGRPSTLHFPAMATSLPRVGERPVRDRAASQEAARKVSTAKEGARKGTNQARKAAAPAAVFRRPDDGRGLRATARAEKDPSGSQPRPGNGFAPHRGSASSGVLGSDVGKRKRRKRRPAWVGSLPSGRSAISLRIIGHARPGIRARMLIKSSPAAAITLSWIQLLRRREVPCLPGYAATEGNLCCTRRLTHYRSRFGDSTKFCGCDPKSHQMWPRCGRANTGSHPSRRAAVRRSSG